MKRPTAVARERRTWAVLGEMFELGPDSRTEHEQVGAVAVAHSVDRLVVVGRRWPHRGTVLRPLVCRPPTSRAWLTPTRHTPC